jgi:integrase
MSIFKRGNVYWYHFLFNGEHIQKSTKQGNPRTARQMEAACRTALAKGEVGIIAPKTAPLFSDLAKRFLAHVETRHENKPQTVVFYTAKLNRLLSYEPLRGIRADRIDEGLIEGYVVTRRASVGPATVNRELATLRRILRLAYEWKEIQRVPRIRLLNGERIRDFVLSRKQEQMYLAACPQPLHDIAVLMLETGLRIGEALNLEWSDVVLEPIKAHALVFSGCVRERARARGAWCRSQIVRPRSLRDACLGRMGRYSSQTGKADATSRLQSIIFIGMRSPQRWKGNAARFLLVILYCTRFVIPC